MEHQKLSKYYLGLNQEDRYSPIILSTNPPYVIGKLLLFKNDFDFLEAYNKDGRIKAALHRFKGYIYLLTTISGKLEGGPQILEQTEAIIKDMAKWYSDEYLPHNKKLSRLYAI